MGSWEIPRARRARERRRDSTTSRDGCRREQCRAGGGATRRFSHRLSYYISQCAMYVEDFALYNVFYLQYAMYICAWAYVRCILSKCGHFSRIESFVCLSLERLFVSLETRDLKAFERRRARHITPRARWGRWARTREGDARESARAALVRVRRRWRARRRRASVRWSRSRCCGVGHPSARSVRAALERTTGRRARACAPRMCACFLPHRSNV
jgi:hypothetical protein